MNFATYESHVQKACQSGQSLDPLVAMSYYRTAMRSPAASKFGTNAYKRAYRDLRDRVRARSYLPDRKPRDFLDAGIMAIAKAQVMA